MSYELRDHTADVAVEATGRTLGEAFAATADGMAAAMCERWPETVGDRHSLAVTAESREALLFDYLDELIYERDIRLVLPVDNASRVERVPGQRRDAGTGADGAGGEHELAWRLEGGYRGVPLDRVEARNLKAVTYSEMLIEETADGWRAYVVFDV